MASRIQGITVEIGGDTTKLSKALESVNKSIKGTQSGLKDVNKLLKLDPSNTELVVQKQKMLKDAIEATKEKLATLKTAAQQARQQRSRRGCYPRSGIRNCRIPTIRIFSGWRSAKMPWNSM